MSLSTLATDIFSATQMFLGAWRTHFHSTRGPWAFGVALGVLLVPILSLLKPLVRWQTYGVCSLNRCLSLPR